jgi:hypothetical protein
MQQQKEHHYQQTCTDSPSNTRLCCPSWHITARSRIIKFATLTVSPPCREPKIGKGRFFSVSLPWRQQHDEKKKTEDSLGCVSINLTTTVEPGGSVPWRASSRALGEQQMCRETPAAP